MPDRHNPLAWLSDGLASLDAQGLRRHRRMFAGSQGPRVVLDGRALVNFGSNDYLALAADARLTESVARALRDSGWGAGASPLVCGRHALHAELESRLAAFEGAEAALLFPSGFAANAGAIPALVGRGDVIYGDAKNHASIIDGCRLSRAEVRVYPHADCEALAEMMAGGPRCRRRLIVTDGLFSMDGDLAPLVNLAELAQQHDAMLMVDEAHATGVFGRRGRGAAEHFGVEERVHVRVGTLSKALGGAGGFVAGSQALIDWLANRARSYVFSTAHPPAQCAAALTALDIIENEPDRRTRLSASANNLRQRLRAAGWNTGPSESQIIPIVIGNADRAMQLSTRLRDAGYFVPGIRPPSVPPGESRLRVSLTSGHRDEWIDGLLDALGDS